MSVDTRESRPAACLSELKLDRLLAGELAPAAQAEARHHLEGCPGCASRRAERERERQLFRDTAPPLFSGWQPRFTARPRRGRMWFATGALAVAAAAVFLIARPRPEETVTPKGKAALRFFVLDGSTGQVRPGSPRQEVHPGDRIRFQFDRAAVAGRHVALIGRDAAGNATTYFPDAGDTARPAPTAEDGLLPYSIALDAALGVETVHALYCREAVALAPVRAALARSGASVVWPASCEVEQVRLEKTPRR